MTYDASAGTATIGAGLIWDDVYAGLEQYDVNVVGGRVTGVGVAGFTLGGGRPSRARSRRLVSHANIRLLFSQQSIRLDRRYRPSLRVSVTERYVHDCDRLESRFILGFEGELFLLQSVRKC